MLTGFDIVKKVLLAEGHMASHNQQDGVELFMVGNIMGGLSQAI